MHRCCCLGENFNCTSLPPYFNTLDKVATRPRSYIKIIKNIFNSFVVFISCDLVGLEISRVVDH